MQCYTYNKLNKCRCTLKTKYPSHEPKKKKKKKLCLAVQNTKFMFSAPQNRSKDEKMKITICYLLPMLRS